LNHLPKKKSKPWITTWNGFKPWSTVYFCFISLVVILITYFNSSLLNDSESQQLKIKEVDWGNRDEEVYTINNWLLKLTWGRGGYGRPESMIKSLSYSRQYDFPCAP